MDPEGGDQVGDEGDRKAAGPRDFPGFVELDAGVTVFDGLEARFYFHISK